MCLFVVFLLCVLDHVAERFWEPLVSAAHFPVGGLGCQMLGVYTQLHMASVNF